MKDAGANPAAATIPKWEINNIILKGVYTNDARAFEYEKYNLLNLTGGCGERDTAYRNEGSKHVCKKSARALPYIYFFSIFLIKTTSLLLRF